MKNSFYYFFSATPQVLGGILALFGVFVIFKIQIIAEVLSKKASNLYTEARSLYFPEDSNEIQKLGVTIKKKIKEGIENKDLSLIKKALDLDKKNTTNQSKSFLSFAEEFNSLYSAKEALYNDTIRFSFLTAVIIIFCLALIPFGDWIICYHNTLMLIFFLVIGLIGYSFFNLISILKRVLK